MHDNIEVVMQAVMVIMKRMDGVIPWDGYGAMDGATLDARITPEPPKLPDLLFRGIDKKDLPTLLRHTETSGWEGIPCGHVNMPGMRHVEVEELSRFRYLQPYRHLLRDAMRLMVPGVDISIQVKGEILQLLAQVRGPLGAVAIHFGGHPFINGHTEAGIMSQTKANRAFTNGDEGQLRGAQFAIANHIIPRFFNLDPLPMMVRSSLAIQRRNFTHYYGLEGARRQTLSFLGRMGGNSKAEIAALRARAVADEEAEEGTGFGCLYIKDADNVAVGEPSCHFEILDEGTLRAQAISTGTLQLKADTDNKLGRYTVAEGSEKQFDVWVSSKGVISSVRSLAKKWTQGVEGSPPVWPFSSREVLLEQIRLLLHDGQLFSGYYTMAHVNARAIPRGTYLDTHPLISIKNKFMFYNGFFPNVNYVSNAKQAKVRPLATLTLALTLKPIHICIILLDVHRLIHTFLSQREGSQAPNLTLSHTFVCVRRDRVGLRP